MSANADSVVAEWARSSSLGGYLIVLLSIASSATAYGFLGETVRIRWTVGTFHHVGPEQLATLPVLVAFPLIAAVLFVCARWIRRYVERSGEIDDADEFDLVYGVCVLLLLGTVVGSQLLIIVLNLRI